MWNLTLYYNSGSLNIAMEVAVENFSTLRTCTLTNIEKERETDMKISCINFFIEEISHKNYHLNVKKFHHACEKKDHETIFHSEIKVRKSDNILPWIATDKSTELKLVADNSLSVDFSFLPFRNGPPFRIRFWDKCSPHKFEPPCVYGILSRAIPWRCGPFARSKDTPSHYKDNGKKWNR